MINYKIISPTYKTNLKSFKQTIENLNYLRKFAHLEKNVGLKNDAEIITLLVILNTGKKEFLKNKNMMKEYLVLIKDIKKKLTINRIKIKSHSIKQIEDHKLIT